MALIGMLASGCGFLLLGLWQAWISLPHPLSMAQPSPSSTATATVQRPRPLFTSAQMISVAALSFLHIVSGLVASRREGNSGDGVGYATPLERSSVALVFFVFAVVNLLRLQTSVLPLPPEMLRLFGIFAFGQEFLLFHLQRPDAGLESRYYDLLLVPIGATMVSLAASIVAPLSILPPLALSGSLFLQGTWLIQMAASFFTSSFMPKGCMLHMRGDGDYVIKCNEDQMALMRGKALATLQFNCHMALLLTLFLPLYSIMRKRCGSLRLDAQKYEMVATMDSYTAKRESDLQSQPPASAFMLELDEDTDDDKSASDGHRHDANGFHRVEI